MYHVLILCKDLVYHLVRGLLGFNGRSFNVCLVPANRVCEVHVPLSWWRTWYFKELVNIHQKLNGTESQRTPDHVSCDRVTRYSGFWNRVREFSRSDRGSDFFKKIGSVGLFFQPNYLGNFFSTNLRG